MKPSALLLGAGFLLLASSRGRGTSGPVGALASLDTTKSWENRQVALRVLGFDPGRIDGEPGPATRTALAAYQRSVGIDDNGKWTRATESSMRDTLANYAVEDGGFPWGQYKPGTKEFRALFRLAASESGIPQWWADSDGLKQIVSRESGGWVGIPNYTYGRPAKRDWPRIWDELRSGKVTAEPTWSPYQEKDPVSTATGLGQLTLSNVDAYYPAWRFGIGIPLQEAMGMLRRIREWYGDPNRAFDCYGVRCESPPCPTKYGTAPCQKRKGFKEGY